VHCLFAQVNHHPSACLTLAMNTAYKTEKFIKNFFPLWRSQNILGCKYSCSISNSLQDCLVIIWFLFYIEGNTIPKEMKVSACIYFSVQKYFRTNRLQVTLQIIRPIRLLIGTIPQVVRTTCPTWIGPFFFVV
jgi:hypothetical protein